MGGVGPSSYPGGGGGGVGTCAVGEWLGAPGAVSNGDFETGGCAGAADSGVPDPNGVSLPNGVSAESGVGVAGVGVDGVGVEGVGVDGGTLPGASSWMMIGESYPSAGGTEPALGGTMGVDSDSTDVGPSSQ